MAVFKDKDVGVKDDPESHRDKSQKAVNQSNKSI
jgi:hypothetical protein